MYRLYTLEFERVGARVISGLSQTNSLSEKYKTHSYEHYITLNILYSGNFLRTINFTIFVDFTATSKIKCNDSLMDPQNLIHKFYH